jgi:hypothetical protein
MYNHDNVTWGMDKLVNKYITGMIEEGAQRLGVKAGLEESEVSYLPLSHIAGNVQLLGGMLYPDHIQSSPTCNTIQPLAFHSNRL